MTEGYLYILNEPMPGSNWVKVGKTINPGRRLKEYNSSFHTDAIEFAFVSDKLYDIDTAERKLLKWLKERDKVDQSPDRFEWFKLKSRASWTTSKRRIKHKYSSFDNSAFIESIISKIEKLTDEYLA